MLRLSGPMTVPQMGRAQALNRQFVQRTVNDAAGLGLLGQVGGGLTQADVDAWVKVLSSMLVAVSDVEVD